MRSIESQNATNTKLKRISWLSQKDSKKVFHNLIHLFNENSLRDCFNELDGKKALGADGISKEQYRENLDENLKDLVSRMKRMAYRPGPVRQVLIPKPGRPNEKRPLGICNFEDKIVQKMTQKVLESIYEPPSWRHPMDSDQGEDATMPSRLYVNISFNRMFKQSSI